MFLHVVRFETKCTTTAYCDEVHSHGVNLTLVSQPIQKITNLPFLNFPMSTFANQLKSEISRIAKREVRAEVQSLKKVSAGYRSEIAALKRRVVALEALVKKQSKPTKVSPETNNEEESTSLRFRVAGFANLRKKLGVTAAEMGKLLGVSAQSVYHWETGKSKPRKSQLQAISAVRKMGKRDVAEKLAE